MNKKAQHLLSIFLVAFFVFIAIGSGDETEENENASSTSTTEETKTEETPKESEKQEGVTISAADLYMNYKENKEKSDSEYKGNFISVEGVIANINKDITDDVYLTLNTNDKFGKIQCHLDKSVAFDQLKKGQSITIYGKTLGIMGNVILEECKVK